MNLQGEGVGPIRQGVKIERKLKLGIHDYKNSS
jgi:hypothetical protein